MFETLLRQRTWRGSSNGCRSGCDFASACLCCIVTSIDLPPKFSVSLFALTGIAMETQGSEITVKLRGKLYQGAQSTTLWSAGKIQDQRQHNIISLGLRELQSAIKFLSVLLVSHIFKRNTASFTSTCTQSPHKSLPQYDSNQMSAVVSSKVKAISRFYFSL